jgi:hypothetical protein
VAPTLFTWPRFPLAVSESSISPNLSITSPFIAFIHLPLVGRLTKLAKETRKLAVNWNKTCQVDDDPVTTTGHALLHRIHSLLHRIAAIKSSVIEYKYFCLSNSNVLSSSKLRDHFKCHPQMHRIKEFIHICTSYPYEYL